MGAKDNLQRELLLSGLGVKPFKERFPWIGPDLQTLRDTFISENLPEETGYKIQIPIPKSINGTYAAGNLLALLDPPIGSLKTPIGLILMLHGLGGSSKRQGLRRMSIKLRKAGFSTLRLNLRGAEPGRHLAGGSYAAECNIDLFPVIRQARELCKQIIQPTHPNFYKIPLFGVGISLGGTILLNACLKNKNAVNPNLPLLDGLVCTSSPLDLASCSSSIERPRNIIYQRWLLKRLIKQIISDPFGISLKEKELLYKKSKSKPKINSIRDFDSIITAPRWGYRNVNHYYSEASPLPLLIKDSSKIPPTLILQSEDDPWVPAKGAKELAARISTLRDTALKVIITKTGGHNGFHGVTGCWGDYLVEQWLSKLVID